MSTGSTNESGAATFAKRVAGTFGVRVLIIVCSFLAGVIIARRLGPAGTGVWASLNVITLLAITIGGFGLPSTITLLVARDTTRARQIILNALAFGVAVGSLLALAISAVALINPGVFGEIPPTLVAIALAALPFQIVSYFCLAAYLGLERIRTYNLVDVSMQACVLINALVTLVLLRSGIFELVIVNTALNIAIALIVVTMAFRATAAVKTRGLDPLLIKEMLGHGSRFFVSLAAGIVILRGDLLIVSYFRGTEEAGVYAIATQASILLQLLPGIVSTILFPRTSASRDQSGLLTSRVTRHAAFIMLLICCTAVPAAFLLPVIYGAAFSGVPSLFLILLPGVFLLGIETIQVQHFTGLGLPLEIPAYWIITMIVNVGSNLLLVPKYGAVAAAVVSTASYALIFLLVALLFRSRTGRSLREMFIIGADDLRHLRANFRLPASRYAPETR